MAHLSFSLPSCPVKTFGVVIATQALTRANVRSLFYRITVIYLLITTDYANLFLLTEQGAFKFSS